MTTHKFYDKDVIMVLMDGHPEYCEIVSRTTECNALLLSKEDIIALAKDFDLIVLDKNTLI